MSRSLLRGDVALSKWLFLTLGDTHGRGRAALRAVERLGQGWLWFGGPAGVLLLSSSPPLRRDAACLLFAMLLDLALVALLKAVVRRPRPAYNLGDTRVFSVDRFSFPSGHASRCALVAALAVQCADGAGAGAGAAACVGVWAAGTAVSRVTMGRHHVSDVLCGVALGLLEERMCRAVFERGFVRVCEVSAAP